MTEEIKDATKDEIVDETTDIIEDKIPSSEELEAQEAKVDDAKDDLQNLLEAQGFDSLEDLKIALSEAEDLKGVIGDEDLDEIKESHKKLKEYQAYWDKQKEERLKAEEEPEDTIKRLEHQLKLKNDESNRKNQLAEEARQVSQQLENFGKTVSAEVNKIEDIPKEHRAFVTKFLGVNNPFNDVDFTNPKEVKKMTAAGVEEFKKVSKKIADQAVKDYLAGKKGIPDMASADASETPVKKENKIKTLKDARKAMGEILTGSLPKIL